MNTKHISQPEYDQLSDREKAGYAKQWQAFIRGKWHDVTGTELIRTINQENTSFGQRNIQTRLVYVPIHPTPEPHEVMKAYKTFEENAAYQSGFIDGIEWEKGHWIDIDQQIPTTDDDILISREDGFEDWVSLGKYIDGQFFNVWDLECPCYPTQWKELPLLNNIHPTPDREPVDIVGHMILNKDIEISRINIKVHDREPEEKNNGWISVKDRLPPKDGVYLVYGSGFRDTPMQVLRANYYKKVFKADNFNGVKTKNVTHWMPLPSPPNI